jgi:hypothetical protein
MIKLNQKILQLKMLVLLFKKMLKYVLLEELEVENHQF